MAVYDDNSVYCWVCKYSTLSDEAKEELESKKGKKVVKSTVRSKAQGDTPKLILTKGKPKKEPLSLEEQAKIKEETTTNCKGYRGLRDETTKYFGVRHTIDEKTGEVVAQHYPTTIDRKLVGYKTRKVPKDFSSKGVAGSECEMFMQFRFKKGKYLLLCESEIDALSAYQMLQDYTRSKNWDFTHAVVAGLTGANSAKQVASQYKFFDSFDKIIICYDNDDAGREAIPSIIEVLPRGKVHIMEMTRKDPNEYLMANDGKAFVSAFYNHKKHVPAGILGSNELYERMLISADVDKIPLPPFMSKLEDMMAGGIPLGYIVNFAAGSGVGKTSIINEMLYYWIFNSPHLIGVVSMELEAGQYAEAVLSRHVGRKIALIKDKDEKLEYLRSDFIQEKSRELFYNEEEDSRWHLVDDRDGGIETLQTTIEELVISCGCKVIVLDPLQDILDGLTNEEQSLFMKWEKSIVKSHNVTFININHFRKLQSKDKVVSEEDIQGTSAIFKSGGANILLGRDKEAEDVVERNTTYVRMPKCRWTGLTGAAGEFYYDNATHTMYDKQYYFTVVKPAEY